MSTVSHLEGLVLNVITGLLKQNEAARTIVEFTTDAGNRLSGSDSPSNRDLVKVVVLGEMFLLRLIPDETDVRFVARLRSEFADFIAESSFGWGELRE